jgi:hypothetical protein
MNDWTGTRRRLRRRWTLTRRTSARRCLIRQLTPGVFLGRRRGTMRTINIPTETAVTKIIKRPPLLFLDTEEPLHGLGLLDNKSLGESSSDLCFIAKRTGGFTSSAWILKRSCAIWATASPRFTSNVLFSSRVVDNRSSTLSRRMRNSAIYSHLD